MNNVSIIIKDDGITRFAFNDSKVKSIKFSNQLMDTSFNINPCVIEQYAEITIKDTDGLVFSNLNALDSYIKKYMDVEVYINDTLFNVYLTSTWEVKIQNSVVTIHCIDATKNLENYQTQLIDVSTQTLDGLIKKAFDCTPYNYSYETSDIRELCENIHIEDTYIQYQKVYDFLNQLCLVAFVRIYWHIDKFVIARCW